MFCNKHKKFRPSSNALAFSKDAQNIVPEEACVFCNRYKKFRPSSNALAYCKDAQNIVPEESLRVLQLT